MLATSYRLSADVQSADGPSDEADRLYEMARSSFARLADRNPEVSQYQSGLASTYLNMSRRQIPATAIDNLEKARSIFNQLMRDYPSNSQFCSDLAGTLRELAVQQIAAGRRDAARENLRMSIDYLQKLVEQFPDNREFAEKLNRSRQEWEKAFSESAPVQSA
jgi:tetratricopeptide (TPR) repeat protein